MNKAEVMEVKFLGNTVRFKKTGEDRWRTRLGGGLSLDVMEFAPGAFNAMLIRNGYAYADQDERSFARAVRALERQVKPLARIFRERKT